MRQDWGKR